MFYQIFAVAMIALSIPVAVLSAAELSKTFNQIEKEERYE